MTFAIIFGCF